MTNEQLEDATGSSQHRVKQQYIVANAQSKPPQNGSIGLDDDSALARLGRWRRYSRLLRWLSVLGWVIERNG